MGSGVGYEGWQRQIVICANHIEYVFLLVIVVDCGLITLVIVVDSALITDSPFHLCPHWPI